MKRSPLQRKTPLRAKRHPQPTERGRAILAGTAPKIRIDIDDGMPSRALPQPIPPEHRRAATMAPCHMPAAPIAKQPVHRDRRLRASARDETCLMRLPDGCLGSMPGAVIASHYRGSAGGKGMGLKASDHAIAYACTHCDAVYDGQRPPPSGWTTEQVQLAWHEAHIRTLLRLRGKGLL